MVKLRLARAGAKKKPFYRIVAADERYPRDGRFLEQVGTYNPIATPSKLTFFKDALEKWLKQGAIATETVAGLIRKHPDGLAALKASRAVDAEAKKASLERQRAARKARRERKAAARKAKAAS